MVTEQFHGTIATRFAQRHLKHNTRIYFSYMLFTGFLIVFGDPSALLPSLVMRMNAPSWLIVFPQVAGMSLAYLPILFVGWLLRSYHVRKKIYACFTLAVFLPYLLLAVMLILQVNARIIANSLLVVLIVTVLGQGVTILPCYDLFARIFPVETRGSVMGGSGGVAQFSQFLGAAAAAWLISSRSPLSFPLNYGVSLAIFALGEIALIPFLLSLQEYTPPERDEARPPFREYVRNLRQIVKEDRALRAVLLGVICAFTIIASSSLMLSYAKYFHGFQGDHISLLITLRIVILIPASFLSGYLCNRIGPFRLLVGIVGISIIGFLLLPFFYGVWMIIPLLLSSLAMFQYSYALVAIMNRAPQQQIHHYITLFYLAALAPGFTPWVCSFFIRQHPHVILGLLILLAITCAFAWLRADRICTATHKAE